MSSAASGSGGAAGSAGGGNSDAAADDLTDAEGTGTCLTIPPWPTPDPFITSGAATASGACSGSTLQQVIDAVHSTHPELADITQIYAPDSFLTDGSYIYALASPGGFRLVFVRGGGDCPSGCMTHEYWYFQTDASCLPVQVGHYLPDYLTSDGGGCLLPGTPMWGVPPPPDPLYVCGADPSPQDISGSYQLCVNGISYPCDTKGASTGLPFHSVTMTVAQNPGDLTKGTVTVSGLGLPRIDGVPLDATFARKRFSVALQYSNLPAQCPDQYSVSIDVDFEGTSAPAMHYAEYHAVGACPPLGETCKGETHF
jgi:hypothetical protein